MNITLEPEDIPDCIYLKFGKEYIKERWSEIAPQILEMKRQIDVTKIRAIQLKK